MNASAASPAAARPRGVEESSPAKSTPRALPIPSARPIVYQSPIAGQSRDAPRLGDPFSGDTTTDRTSAFQEATLTNDDRPLLVFFWSERSGPARRMESLLAHLERKERERLRVRRVDVDASPEIAERFQVGVVPTLVLIKDRKAVSRIDGRPASGPVRFAAVKLPSTRTPSGRPEPSGAVTPTAVPGYSHTTISPLT